MTAEQLKVAAYEYCRIRGLDPEEQVDQPNKPDAHGVVFDVIRTTERWALVAEDLKSQHFANQALQTSFTNK